MLLILAAGWNFVTFNASAFSSTYLQPLSNSSFLVSQGINSTQATYLQEIYSGLYSLSTVLQQSLLVFLPILAIVGAFMMLTAFYLRSKSRKTLSYGVIFAMVFSLLFFIGVLIYLPIAPSNVAVFFSYLGSFTGNALELGAAYVLLFAYVVLGLLASIFGLYRLLLSHENP
jgi:uncharacterized membrane protein